jgi:hypothetical protein
MATGPRSVDEQVDEGIGQVTVWGDGTQLRDRGLDTWDDPEREHPAA